MTTRHDDFDRQARALHAQAVQQVPSRTLEQLRIRRARGMSTAPAPSRGPRFAGWTLAAACTAVFALAIGLRQPGIDQMPAANGAAPLATADSVTDYEAFAAFDEDPDLFLWLASQDALSLAME